MATIELFIMFGALEVERVAKDIISDVVFGLAHDSRKFFSRVA